MTKDTAPSTASKGSPIPQSAFTEALQCFIDETKPDPLERKQLLGWKLEWRQQRDAPNDDSDNTLTGTLGIQGEYMMVMLDSKCKWSDSLGILDFELRARARFVTADSKSKRKIQTKMKKRLSSDDYIKPLLENKMDDGVLLVEAHIQQHGDQLEERVFCDDTVA